ncbi:MAG: hypothetical protein D6747_07635, partial [Chlorobiota bacterium]
MPETLHLSFGFTYADLHSPYGLRRLYERWEAYFAARDADGYAAFSQLRQQGVEQHPTPSQSTTLMRAAEAVEQFLLELFGLEQEHAALAEQIVRERRIVQLRSDFLKRAALRHKQLDTSTA